MSYIEFVSCDNQAEDPLPELARANRFTMHDLEMNRQGKISDTQMGRLFKRALMPIRYPGVALLGWLVCSFIVKTLVPGIILLIAAIIGIKGIGILFGIVTVVCAGALLVALLSGGRNVILLLQDLSTGIATHIDGRVTVSREEQRGLGMDHFHDQKRMQFWYVAQNNYFEVDEAAAEALPPGGRFRLYFAPKSKLLLSIEPVPAAS